MFKNILKKKNQILHILFSHINMQYIYIFYLTSLIALEDN